MCMSLYAIKGSVVCSWAQCAYEDPLDEMRIGFLLLSAEQLWCAVLLQDVLIQYGVCKCLNHCVCMCICVCFVEAVSFSNS